MPARFESRQENATLHDLETKLVEFLNASGVAAKSLYVYDGAQFPVNYGCQDLRQNRQYARRPDEERVLTYTAPYTW